jgi:hypothetical protein
MCVGRFVADYLARLSIMVQHVHCCVGLARYTIMTPISSFHPLFWALDSSCKNDSARVRFPKIVLRCLPLPGAFDNSGMSIFPFRVVYGLGREAA